MPLSDTGVSQRFSTCSFCRCSLIICRPVSPNCVAHRFKYRSAGSLISCSAHADVTEVKAKLRHSRLPRARPPNRRATSASVARTGSVNLRGPPFCCWQERDQTRVYKRAYEHNKSLRFIIGVRTKGNEAQSAKTRRAIFRAVYRNNDSRRSLPAPADSSASDRERRSAPSRIP